MVKEMSNFERSQEHSVNSLAFSLVEKVYGSRGKLMFPPLSMFELMFDTNRSDLIENKWGGKESHGVNSSLDVFEFPGLSPLLIQGRGWTACCNQTPNPDIPSLTGQIDLTVSMAECTQMSLLRMTSARHHCCRLCSSHPNRYLL